MCGQPDTAKASASCFNELNITSFVVVLIGLYLR